MDYKGPGCCWCCGWLLGRGHSEDCYETGRQRGRAEVLAELETERMRLAACSAAALANTPDTVAQRIAPGHLYYSAAYGDVCRAVDSEIAARTKLADVLAEVEKLREWAWAERNNSPRDCAESRRFGSRRRNRPPVPEGEGVDMNDPSEVWQEPMTTERVILVFPDPIKGSWLILDCGHWYHWVSDDFPVPAVESVYPCSSCHPPEAQPAGGHDEQSPT